MGEDRELSLNVPKEKSRSRQTGCEENSLGGWRVICYSLEGTLGFAFSGFDVDTKNSHPTNLSLY